MEYGTNGPTYKTEINRVTDVENKLLATMIERGKGINWEIGIDLTDWCSVTQSCLIFCDPMDCGIPGLPVLDYLLEFAQTHAH